MLAVELRDATGIDIGYLKSGVLAEALQDSMIVTIKLKSALIEKNIAEIDLAWSAYMVGLLTSRERQLADNFAAGLSSNSGVRLLPSRVNRLRVKV